MNPGVATQQGPSDVRRPVLVYQMGKVGSRSLVAAPEKLPGIEVLHVHSLNLDTLERMKKQHRVRGEPFPLHITVAERINRDIVIQGRPLESTASQHRYTGRLC